jgi:hypothetical protein
LSVYKPLPGRDLSEIDREIIYFVLFFLLIFAMLFL